MPAPMMATTSAPLKHFAYTGFCDPAGGSGQDSMTLGIAHLEENIALLDLLREIKLPFSPQDAAEQFSDVIKAYGIKRVFGDRYAAAWVVDAFQLHGVTYEHSELNRSELYVNLLPMMNSRTCALIDNERLRRQLLGLERRTGRSGRDTIDHARGAHDDLANAAAGALALAKHEPMARSIPGFSRRLDLPRMSVA